MPDDYKSMIDAAPILARMAKQLQAAGCDTPRLDARLILGLALGRDGGVFPHETIAPLTRTDHARLEEFLAQRLGGVPVSRLRGWREFYGLRFALSPATLDPRADSEVMVSAATRFMQSQKPDNAMTILDCGTGSGCLLLAVLYNYANATGLGIDIDADAISIAQRNAQSLGLANRANFLQSNWDAALPDDTCFDVILANPPYIPTADIPALAHEVRRHDPIAALDGGADGLQSIRQILPLMARRLAAHGRGFMEIGAGQGEAVSRLAEAAGLQIIARHKDLAGIDRCLVFAPPAKKIQKNPCNHGRGRYASPSDTPIGNVVAVA